MTSRDQTAAIRTVTPYLVVADAEPVLAFLKGAFGAETTLHLTRTNGTLMHAEVRIGDSIVMLGEAMEGFDPVRSHIFLRVDDADAAYERALAAGGKSFMPPTDMPHAGERYSGVLDPAGNTWWPAQSVEDVSPDEQQRRINDLGL